MTGNTEDKSLTDQNYEQAKSDHLMAQIEKSRSSTRVAASLLVAIMASMPAYVDANFIESQTNKNCAAFSTRQAFKDCAENFKKTTTDFRIEDARKTIKISLALAGLSGSAGIAFGISAAFAGQNERRYKLALGNYPQAHIA